MVGGCLVVVSAFPAAADVTYFLVGSQLVGETNESYVLPLTRAEDTAEARRQLTELDFTNRLIVVARVAAGADGINRDLMAPGKPPWSWHVTEFTQFAEGVVEILDGTPSGLEYYVKCCWNPDASGTIAIGFVPWRVVAELNREDIFFVSVRPTAIGASLSWLGLGSNYVYTVEASASLAPASWSPAVDGSWPITATNWVDQAALVSGTRYYRVRAEPMAAPQRRILP